MCFKFVILTTLLDSTEFDSSGLLTLATCCVISKRAAHHACRFARTGYTGTNITCGFKNNLPAACECVCIYIYIYIYTHTSVCIHGLHDRASNDTQTVDAY